MNVGCIPKKLFHYAGVVGEEYKFLAKTGWGVEGKVGEKKIEHKWEVMVEAVNGYIKSLNFGYKKELNTQGVTYFNKLASLISPHQI